MNQDKKKKKKKRSNDRFAEHEVQYLDSNVAALQVQASS